MEGGAGLIPPRGPAQEEGAPGQGLMFFICKQFPDEAGLLSPSLRLRSRPERGGPGPLPSVKVGPLHPFLGPCFEGWALPWGLTVPNQRPLWNSKTRRAGCFPLREHIPQRVGCLQGSLPLPLGSQAEKMPGGQDYGISQLSQNRPRGSGSEMNFGLSLSL